MTKNRFKWSAIATVLVAASFASGLASAADEHESVTDHTCNNSLAPSYIGTYFAGKPQPLVFDGSGVAVMNGALINDMVGNQHCNYFSHGGNFYRDVDFYSFHADAGQNFDIRISNAWNGTYTWATLGVYGPPDSTGSYPLLTSDSIDKEPFIDGGFHANAAGTYYVAVSSIPGYLEDNGVLLNYQLTNASPDDTAPGSIGDYTLTVKPAAPPVLPISIEIKPGVHTVTVLDAGGVAHPATLRGTARGHLPVVLLSSKKDNFYPMEVDQSKSKLHFGATGKEESLVSCSSGRGIDFNNDGIPDLLCHFDMQKANFALSETEGYLTGQTKGGVDFAGHAWMKIVVMGLTPEKLGFGHKK